MTAASVAREHATDRDTGLDGTEAGRRLASVGPNELPQERPPKWWRLLLHQFASILMGILGAAIVLSILLGHAVEALAIVIILAFSVAIGFVQERKAQHAIQALRALAAPKAQVVREGHATMIEARDVVPGDLLILNAGDRVPADGRLVEAIDLEVAEASLTGESVPVEKDAARVMAEAAPLGDRANMVYSSTLVTRGRGRAVATATGVSSEIGRIGAMLTRVRPAPTPLERQLARMARWLIWTAVTVVVLIMVAGLLRGFSWIDMLLFGVALAVAVVPEALPAVVTISLALGAKRMARRNAIVRRLPVVETLGSTTVICSDKTGTLTQGEMTAAIVVTSTDRYEVTGSGYAPTGSLVPRPTPPDEPVLRELGLACGLCNDAEVVREDGRWIVRGDPTEGALVALAGKLGTATGASKEIPRLREISFSSERKRMTTVHPGLDRPTVYSKGAPETILSSCLRQWTREGVRPLTPSARQDLMIAAAGLASGGMRVLAVSTKTGDDRPEEDQIFLALVGLRDPPRPESRAAIRICHQAGIRPIMITGDHPATATAVAAELGLLNPQLAVTGPELEAMDSQALGASVQTCNVYARVSPAHKLAIVTALQAQREIVAMTGDGVNDAPALRKADIGVAMGITGTDVAKEASAMMLADDNFTSIVSAVQEGRGIYDNVRKYLVYLMSTNFGEVALIAAAMLLGLPLPLTAVMILYVNLASDGLPALALAVDPQDPDIMRRSPRPKDGHLLDRPTVALMVLGGLWSAGANLTAFAWARSSGRSIEEAMTITFVSLVLIQFTKAYVFRSLRRPIWVRPFGNRWLNRAVAWEIFLLLLILYLPAARGLFGVYPLTPTDWLVVLATALSVVPALEIGKRLSRLADPLVRSHN